MLVLFFASILLILAFANLSKTDAAILVVRGLCVSYVGLLAAMKALARTEDGGSALTYCRKNKQPG